MFDVDNFGDYNFYYYKWIIICFFFVGFFVMFYLSNVYWVVMNLIDLIMGYKLNVEIIWFKNK